MKSSVMIVTLSIVIAALTCSHAKAATILDPNAFTSLGTFPVGNFSIDTNTLTLSHAGGTLSGVAVSQFGGPVTDEIPDIAVFTFDGGATLAATDTITITNNSRAVALLFLGSAALSGTIDGANGQTGHFNDGQLPVPGPDDGKGGPGGPGGFRGNTASFNTGDGKDGKGPGGGGGGGSAASSGGGGGGGGSRGAGQLGGTGSVSGPGGAAGAAVNDLSTLPLRGGSGGGAGGSSTGGGGSGSGGGGGAMELVSLGLLDLSGLRIDLSGGDGGSPSPNAAGGDSGGGGGGGGGGALLTSSASLTLSLTTSIDLSGGLRTGRSGAGGGGEFLGFISASGTFIAPAGALTTPGFIIDIAGGVGADLGTKAIVTVIPEPSTLLLIIMGTISLLAYGARRRR